MDMVDDYNQVVGGRAMSEFLDPETITGTSSAAVEKATGKSWAEWMELLDAARGQEMNHKQLVAHLVENYEDSVSAWWQQQLTVGYEQSRGLRAKHEMTDGYQISRSRTVVAPIAAVFDAWADATTRARWLPDAPDPTRTTPPRRLRLTWGDGTAVVVELTDKGERTGVNVQHNKLPDAATAEAMKAYWAEALGRLAALW
jgi:uncharacterized protein YndB with AHSA1/START domain